MIKTGQTSKRKQTINIANRKFSLVFPSAIIGDDGKECYGLANHGTSTISVATAYPSLFNTTLIHELLHALLNASGADQLIEQEETFVRILTPHLLSVIEQIIAKGLIK